jgi:hypothetical protein
MVIIKVLEPKLAAAAAASQPAWPAPTTITSYIGNINANILVTYGLWGFEPVIFFRDLIINSIKHFK